jgi:glucuronide carrier protein
VALLVAMFSIPGGLGAGGKLAWAYASYALFQLAYSFVNIPYGSLSAVMTQEPDERAKLSTGRVIASSPAILLTAVVVSPQVSGSGHLQKSLTITTIAFALVGFALYVWCFGRERYCEDLPPARTCRSRLRWWRPCCWRASAQGAPL